MVAVFDPEDSKWRACCCHVTSFVKVISWLGVIFSGIALIFSIYHIIAALTNNHPIGWMSWVFPIICILTLILNFCPIIGIKKTIPELILPLIISYIIQLVTVPLRIIFNDGRVHNTSITNTGILDDTHHRHDEAPANYGVIGGLLVALPQLALTAYFLWVAYRGTDMDAFCSNSACLTYVNSIINDFPDCSSRGVNVKEHVQMIVDGCGATSTAASGASTDNSTETTATEAPTATESSTATESTGTDSSTATGSSAGTQPTVGAESSTASGSSAGTASTASGSSADTGSSSSASSVALSASMAVVVGVLAVAM